MPLSSTSTRTSATSARHCTLKRRYRKASSFRRLPGRAMDTLRRSDENEQTSCPALKGKLWAFIKLFPCRGASTTLGPIHLEWLDIWRTCFHRIRHPRCKSACRDFTPHSPIEGSTSGANNSITEQTTNNPRRISRAPRPNAHTLIMASFERISLLLLAFKLAFLSSSISCVELSLVLQDATEGTGRMVIPSRLPLPVSLLIARSYFREGCIAYLIALASRAWIDGAL